MLQGEGNGPASPGGSPAETARTEAEAGTTPGSRGPTEGTHGAEANDGVVARVGVLLVHGMGEQKPGAHVERVVRSLLKSWEGALSAGHEVRDVLVRKGHGCEDGEPTASTGDGRNRNREESPRDTPCNCPECARIIIRVTVGGGNTVDLHCHEVWWADLGQRSGLKHALRFWGWVCSTPFRMPKVNTGQEAEHARRKTWRMVDPKLESRFRWLACLGERIILGYFVLLTLVVRFTWGLLRQVVRRWAPSPVILLRSFGDVALYQEEARADTGSGVDMVLPPRFAIRRRMVREMVAMAERGYDKWFVMAHSLGSVVAFNGLMEPDYILPNYLSEEHWRRIKSTRFYSETGLGGDGLSAMRPRRPRWLADRDGVSRERLFERLAGFVTYGSPLHLFARLWPNTVPVNLRHAFGGKFRWINIHSPLDPISGALGVFQKLVKKGQSETALTSHLYAGSWRAFIAHAEYLRDKGREVDFCRALGRWFLSVSDFELERGVSAAWARFLVCLQVGGMTVLLTAVVLLLVSFLVPNLAPAGAAFRDTLSELVRSPFEFE